MPHHIAYATYDQMPAGTDDDGLTMAPLNARGVTVTPAIWNDPGVDWTRFDLVVIRSTWDYFVYPEDFRRWLDQLEARQVRVLNPIPVLRWNMDKSYLRQLAASGVNVVPTRWAQHGEPADLGAILREEGWEKAVIKPAVSGGAFHTGMVTLDTLSAAQSRLEELLQGRDMMIQRYMEEINAEGEWSLLFFNRKFSHAVVKRPARGDFRVQAHLGGAWEDATPSAETRATAASILAQVDSTLLYARVDGLIHQGRFMLVELEILEPNLFLGARGLAQERFAEAILEHLVPIAGAPMSGRLRGRRRARAPLRRGRSSRPASDSPP